MNSDKDNVLKRAVKGSPLTHAELDTNFSELVNVIDDVTDAVTNALRFIGKSATDPTSRDDGGILVIGDTYFNTTTKLDMRYDGTIWMVTNESYLAATGGATKVGAVLPGGSNGNIQQAINALDAKIDNAVDAIDTSIDELHGTTGATKVGATLPTGATGTTQQALDILDASLEALASANGTAYVGYGGRTLLNKLGEYISVKDAPFNAKGDGTTDDTAAIQAAFNYIAALTSAGLTTSGALSTSYSGTSPRLYFPKGTYKITSAITLGAYLEVMGESAIIKQYTDSEDIFTCQFYQFKMQGMQFVGGRHQLSLYNANTNSTMAEISHCQFFLSRGRAIHTYAIGTDGSGNAWSHLSADLDIYKCRFIACDQTLNNCCDSAEMYRCWIQPSKINMTASTAVIINKGTSASDPNCLTRLHIKDCFLIPDVGVEGVDRINNARWVDNYGSFTATNSRFGGENGGMQIVAHVGAPNTDFPWNSTEVVLKGCMLFAGPDARSDSCVLAIQGQIPNRFVMTDCTGPLGKPIIANLSSTDIPAYMAAFEAAVSGGRKAYEYFKIDIGDVLHDINVYSPMRTIIPDSLYPYLIKGRNTRVRKQNQSIPNGMVSTNVSFDTVLFDNVGAFKIASPTQLVMPNGCSKMRINVMLVMAVDGAAKTMDVSIIDSGSTQVAGNVSLRGINAYSDTISLSADVFGPPGSTWTVRVRHSAAAALNMIDCKVSCVPIDLIA